MQTEKYPEKELTTADDPSVALCAPEGPDGPDHDYRPFVRKEYGLPREHTYWRCVWCHVVSCGDVGETDPCIEPYHHRVPHRTTLGVTWPVGGDRPKSDRKVLNA